MKEINDKELEMAAGGRSINVNGYWFCPESRICKYYKEKDGILRLPEEKDSCDNCSHQAGKNQYGNDLCNVALVR